MSEFRTLGEPPSPFDKLRGRANEAAVENLTLSPSKGEVFGPSVLRRGFLALVAAALAACQTVGPDFQRPATPTQTSYAMTGDRSPQAAAYGEQVARDWWSLYRSAALDRVVREAVAGNRNLEAARATLAQARDAIAAQDPRLRIDANASVTEERINFAAFGFSGLPGSIEPLKNPTVTLYSFGAGGRYDFDLFGQRRRETERLYAEAESAAREADAAYLTLTAQVVGQAIGIAAARAQIAALEGVATSDRENLRLVQDAYRLGGGTRLDVSTVESELANDEAQVAPLRTQLGAARHALALLVGQPPSGWTAPDFDLSGLAQPRRIPVALPSDLVRARPDILAAEARLHAAVAEIGVRAADLYPKLSLTGALTQAALTPGKLFTYNSTGWSIAPGITLPIFDRKQLSARRAGAEDAARAALANYEGVVLQAFAQVADALEAIALDNEAIALRGRELAAVEDSLNLQRLRYRAGKSALLPVLDAQRTHARARQALAVAHAQRLRDCAQLLYATGRGWNEGTPTAKAALLREIPDGDGGSP